VTTAPLININETNEINSKIEDTRI